MTHDELVSAGRRWLCRNHAVVATEVMATAESPDVIGWTYQGCSTLIECKATRADFKTDAQKHFRQFPGCGMGSFRYYLTPPGLIYIDDLPPCWGLITTKTGKTINVIREAQPQERDNSQENQVLISLLRRGVIAHQSLSINVYDSPTVGKSSLTLPGIPVEPLSNNPDDDLVNMPRWIAETLLRDHVKSWQRMGYQAHSRHALLTLRAVLAPIDPDIDETDLDDKETRDQKNLAALMCLIDLKDGQP
jgi:hypothetical protein